MATLSRSLRASAPAKPAAASRKAVVVRATVQQQQQTAAPAATATTRRSALAGAALAAAAALAAVAPAPASAFLGFGDGGAAADEKYKAATAAILQAANDAIALDRDDPDRDAKVKAVRDQINGWVATYRRDQKFSGRPSFGNTYSALNALTGHYNSFGTQAPIPKKRLERLTKELADASTFLERGR